jgi:hypothetical protein
MINGILDSNQKIVSNGLVLNLDAAQLRSYPGSGTTWTDLSGNANNGTLTNGPTFNSGNGGSISFDGTNDSITSFSTQISGNGSKTVECWFYLTKSTRAGLCGTRSSNVASDGWVLTLNRTTAGNLTYFHTGTASTLEISAGISQNTWYQCAVTYNTSTAEVKFYVNGIQSGTTFTSVATINTSIFNGSFGQEGNNTSSPYQGRIAISRIYNTVLTDSEILQNYNAVKSRFGL